MNKLREAIEKLEAMEERSELNEILLQRLRAKEQELGSDPSEEMVSQAVNQVLKEHVLYALEKKRGETRREDEWDEEMDENRQVIRDYFERKELHYQDDEHQKGVWAFKLGLRENGKTLRIHVYLEASPRVCRVDAIYPFQGESEFMYPLCQVMAKENYPRRFGALQYDEKDGELSYRYSFLITHGLREDEFSKIFMAVVASAYESYDVVKKYAVGRLKKEERTAVICKAQQLILELDS